MALGGGTGSPRYLVPAGKEKHISSVYKADTDTIFLLRRYVFYVYRLEEEDGDFVRII